VPITARWGSLSAPPEPLAAKRGPTSKGRGEGRGGMGEEGRGEEGRGRKGKGEGKGSPLPRNPRSATAQSCFLSPNASTNWALNASGRENMQFSTEIAVYLRNGTRHARRFQDRSVSHSVTLMVGRKLSIFRPISARYHMFM